jgi:SOS response associated peptidase (SRAP)
VLLGHKRQWLDGNAPDSVAALGLREFWGLIPAKVADPDSFKIYTTSNARAESILDKPIWKGPFQHSRCLIPVDLEKVRNLIFQLVNIAKVAEFVVGQRRTELLE